LPSIGAVGEPTGATNHWVNKEANPAAMQFLQNNDPFSPGFNGGKKDFINTGVDQGLGIVDGAAVSIVGVFSQSGASYLYNQFKQGGENLSNPGAFNEGLNLTSYGDINLSNLNSNSGTGYEPPKENVGGSTSTGSPSGTSYQGGSSNTVSSNSDSGYEPPNNNSIPTP
jgi:hypothetical protein